MPGREGGPAIGLVLTLIVVTDEAGPNEAVRATSQAGREHPCRTLGVVTRDPGATARLDAEICSGVGSPGETV